ncbi:uncharacterized protein RAG0_00594 [Rhynchosporium agropyri]|uniref:Uncharacterized protein n=1 Tax=Rhynchosporium agropyri TaxID=914238 RepID=A0A1E1JTZ4_9HELO|nr:uncharacterized protein RAG0_00594 [Rhynchosporium agropyri]
MTDQSQRDSSISSPIVRLPTEKLAMLKSEKFTLMESFRFDLDARDIRNLPVGESLE